MDFELPQKMVERFINEVQMIPFVAQCWLRFIFTSSFVVNFQNLYWVEFKWLLSSNDKISQ